MHVYVLCDLYQDYYIQLKKKELHENCGSEYIKQINKY